MGEWRTQQAGTFPFRHEQVQRGWCYGLDHSAVPAEGVNEAVHDRTGETCNGEPMRGLVLSPCLGRKVLNRLHKLGNFAYL
jgi:transcriptional regulator NrdR family protein